MLDVDPGRGRLVGSAADRKLVPVTYYAPGIQAQYRRNAETIGAKGYADFFGFDLSVPEAWAKALQHGPMPLEQTLSPSIADINKLLDPSVSYPDAGYALLRGPTAYVQSRIEMAGATAEMFRWWFLWHPIEKERYMLWFPHAHIDNSIADPTRLADASLSYEERLYGNLNFVEEFIGPSSLKIVMHFADPGDLGLDRAALRRAGFTACACATIRIAEAPDTTFMFMLHLARDTGRGLELFSRYWIGAHPEFARFPGGSDAPALLGRLGMNEAAIANLSYEMAIHDMTEFAQLARILPALYGRYGRSPA